MKRFIVLQEIWLSDVQSSDNPGYEPIADFDSLQEAKTYIAKLQDPEDFHVEDTQEVDELDSLYDDDEDEDEDVADIDDRLFDEEDGYLH